MRFMMMIKSDAKAEAGILPDQASFAAMGKFNEQMAAAGVMLGGEGLRASVKGVRVRLKSKEFTVVDGPFAEAKELIAGFWLMQAPSLREAVEWAKRVPVEDGEIEVRRLWEMSDFPSSPTDDEWRASEGRYREEQAQAAPPRLPGTTRYLIMLSSDRATESGDLPPAATMNRMGALMEEQARSGALLGGEGLRPSRDGARVKIAGGRRTVLDGPFSETKELIAGYVMLQVPALADAIAFARGWLPIHLDADPGSDAGEIEIRPLFELADLPADGAGAARA